MIAKCTGGGGGDCGKLEESLQAIKFDFGGKISWG